MITRINVVTVVAAGLLVACSAQSNVAGGDGLVSYIASDTDGALMVQITSVHDGRVNGVISVVGAADSGRNVAGTRNFSGTIEGKALNLSIENGTGLSLATGELEDDTLRLTLFANGKSSQFTLAKSNAEEFTQLASASRVRAAKKIQDAEIEAAHKDQVERRSKTQRSIGQLADNAFTKAGEVSEKIRRIDVVIAGYRAARDRTARMQTAKHNIDGDSPDGSYRISQLDYQIDSLATDMESTHSGVQSYLTDLSGFVNDATLKSTRLLGECQADRLLDCSRLSASMQSLQVRYQQFRRDSAREATAFNDGRNVALR